MIGQPRMTYEFVKHGDVKAHPKRAANLDCVPGLAGLLCPPE